MKIVPLYALAAGCFLAGATMAQTPANSDSNTSVSSSSTTVQTKDCGTLSGTERTDCVAKMKQSHTTTKKTTSSSTDSPNMDQSNTTNTTNTTNSSETRSSQPSSSRTTTERTESTTTSPPSSSTPAPAR